MSIPSSDPTSTPSRRLRMAVVGCGAMAPIHIRAFRSVGVDTVLVCDLSPDAAAACAASVGAEAVSDVAALIARGGIDLAVVCTPPGAHEQACIPLLEARIPVLCEKPLAMTASQAERLHACAQANGVPLFVGYCHRWHPGILALRARVLAGEIGRPRYLQVQFAGMLDLSANHRGVKRLSGGGVLIDNGSHAIDLMRFLLGDPQQVFAAASSLVQRAEVEDFCLVHFTGDGWAASVSASFSLPHAENIVTLHGDRGRISFRYSGGERNGVIEQVVAGVPGVRHHVVEDRTDRFVRQAGEVIAVLEAGGSSGGNGWDGVAAAHWVDAAYASAARGVVVLRSYPVAGSGGEDGG